MHIVLLRFQGVPEELPQKLEAPLRAVFSLPVSTAPRALRLPPAAYYQDREQWRAAALLSAVEAAPAHGEPPGSVRLGIAAHDLFATGLNFVFGEASHTARCAVFSIARYDCNVVQLLCCPTAVTCRSGRSPPTP
jgi:predicted Zn-dependent protease